MPTFVLALNSARSSHHPHSFRPCIYDSFRRQWSIQAPPTSGDSRRWGPRWWAKQDHVPQTSGHPAAPLSGSGSVSCYFNIGLSIVCTHVTCLSEKLGRPGVQDLVRQDAHNGNER